MKKKKSNWFMRLLVVLFIIFIGLFIAEESGYYEAKVSRNVALTNEAIKKFEEDVLNGVAVDINSYIENDDNDYSNSLTKAGDKISGTMENLMSGGFTNVWEVLKMLFLGK